MPPCDVLCLLDGVTVSDCSSPKDAPLGAHNFTAVVVSPLGLTSTITSTWTVLAPNAVIDISSPQAVGIARGNLNIPLQTGTGTCHTNARREAWGSRERDITCARC